MRNNASTVYSFFLVIGDVLALMAAFVGAYILRVTLDSRPLIESVPSRTYIGVFVALVPFWIIIFALLGLYTQNIYEKRFAEIGRLFVGSFVGMLFVIGYNFFSATPFLPARLVPIYGLVLAFLFLVLIRTIARAVRTILFSYQIGISNVLIIGSTPITNELVSALADTKTSGYRVVGVVADSSVRAAKSLVFSSFEQALQALTKTRIHAIIQTELYKNEEHNQQILTYAQTKHISYRFAPGNSELFVGNIDVELFQSSLPVIAVHQTALLGWGRIVKRLFDLCITLPVLVIASPFMLIIALILKIGYGESVFFRQVRLTRYDQEFRIFKFRTQKQQYDGTTPEEAFQKIGKPELAKQYRENGDYLAKDPRVTRFGRFLRASSLDELPQLFNVVRGDLSLVGPRALIPQELHQYDKHHTILSVKSGLTGLAQVSGRRSISFEERRKLDMYYVQNWSFWLDLTILLKTIVVIITGSGAK